MDNYGKNIKLKIEISNELYNIFDEAFLYMASKKRYKKHDLVKLILAIFKGKYKYMTNDNGYRDQISLLNNYFKEEYNYSLVSFILIKKLKNENCDQFLLTEIPDRDIREQIIYFLETENYAELLELIESDKKIFIALAKVYEQACKRKD